jgi:hypothetical protein
MHNYNSGAATVVPLVSLREEANCGHVPDKYPDRHAVACEVVPNAMQMVSVDIVFCTGRKGRQRWEQFVWFAIRHH